MKKVGLVGLALLLLALGQMAAADTQYIIPDSDVRQLTEEELWTWDYESLGYILNEIFARHGYNFNPGEAYDTFFRSRPWYVPNADSDNQRACYSQLNAVEWYNERLIKDVRSEMRSTKNYNTDGKSIWDLQFSSAEVFDGFAYVSLKPNQKFPVYSAPSDRAWRGANGKASMSTNGAVYAGGWDGGWLLVMYEVNSGAMRVGYIDGQQLQGDTPHCDILQFACRDATIQSQCTLTDDPVRTSAAITTLMPGAAVRYLRTYTNAGTALAYVETTVGGQTARGFVPASCVAL